MVIGKMVILSDENGGGEDNQQGAKNSIATTNWSKRRVHPAVVLSVTLTAVLWEVRGFLCSDL